MLASETARVVAAKLPAIPVVRRVSQAVAMLDAVLMPEAWLRYYSFAADWNGSGWSLAQMRNGQGDDYLIAFTPEGAFIKGFAHDSAMSPWSFHPPHPWRGLTETVPTEFAACLHEPAFSMEDTTFCIWRRNQDPAWQTGFIAYPDSPYADGAGELLHLLVDPRPAAYQAWAEDYHQRPGRPGRRRPGLRPAPPHTEPGRRAQPRARPGGAPAGTARDRLPIAITTWGAGAYGASVGKPSQVSHSPAVSSGMPWQVRGRQLHGAPIGEVASAIRSHDGRMLVRSR